MRMVIPPFGHQIFAGDKIIFNQPTGCICNIFGFALTVKGNTVFNIVLYLLGRQIILEASTSLFPLPAAAALYTIPCVPSATNAILFLISTVQVLNRYHMIGGSHFSIVPPIQRCPYFI